MEPAAKLAGARELTETDIKKDGLLEALYKRSQSNLQRADELETRLRRVKERIFGSEPEATPKQPGPPHQSYIEITGQQYEELSNILDGCLDIVRRLEDL